MSDTPRTESEVNRPHGPLDGVVTVDADFACQLERELNAASVEIEEKRKDIVYLATEKAKLENYVMRLEEAHSWRLIETAPHNYTWILGYDEKDGETGMIIFNRGDESEPHWTDGMREWSPTHWMPLPDEPKAKEAKL